jgi:membrane associated rhomboid family serine protease
MDRDYYRDDDRGAGVGRFLRGEGIVCRSIVVITVIVFIAQVLGTGAGDPIAELLDFSRAEIESFQVWRFVTYAFCHRPEVLSHILFNMLGLWFFGPRLEDLMRPREFLAFYLTAAVASSTTWLFIQYLTGVNASMYGASGATCAVFMLYAWRYPHDEVRLYFLIPIKIWVAALIYFAFDLHPVLLQLGGAPVPGRTAHAGHLGGMLFGLLYGYADLRLTGWLGRTTPAARRRRWFTPKMSVERPRRGQEREPPATIRFPGVGGRSASADDDELDRRVDELLIKVKDGGLDSLTEAERQFLNDASRRIRQRKS